MNLRKGVWQRVDEIIIGVDTGNRCIKTRNHVFVAGVKQFEVYPAVSKDIITFNGKYYVLSSERVSYLQDKTKTEEYFAMTLFAIMKELNTRGISTQKNTPIPIHLGVGLPPSHVTRLRDKFIKYFNRGQFCFRYNEQAVSLKILDVRLLAQGYAAIASFPDEVKRYPHAYIVDIGGYTTDVMALEHGALDPRFCESLDYGVIQLYNKIQRQIHMQTGKKLSEDMIDEMLDPDKLSDFDKELLEIAIRLEKDYAAEIFRKLLEFDVDLTINRGIFVGGGASKLRPYIGNSSYVKKPFFVSDIHANAIGYELFVKAFESRKQR